ncbi:hypothetical protein ABZ553_36995 [Streptomyces sparsogenes]|uniref:hypothetical protein n=1 Tax=Streptomyces sparsogenes TaxID=67365 RepID=UPI0033FCE706
MQKVHKCRRSGEMDGASGEKPASTWPDGPGKPTRPSVVSVWRRDGGNIGF